MKRTNQSGVVRTNRNGSPAAWPGIALCGLLAGLAAADARGQTYPLFSDTPEVYTQSPEVFRAIVQQARSQTVRAVVIGDSQETSPGGAGNIYLPRLNYEFFLEYGNAPETPVTSVLGSTGSGAPWSDWLVRVANAQPGQAPSRVPFSQFPPNIAGAASTSLGGGNINNNQLYGSLIMLQHDAADTNPGAGVAGLAAYFDVSQGVYVDVYAASNPSSGEVRCRITPATSHVPSYFQPTTQTAITSLALDQPGTLFRRQRLGPFGLNGRPYFQVELSGTSPSALTDIVAVDISSAANPQGWVVSSLSAGGFKAGDYLAVHPDGSDFVAVYAPDVAFITFGANDAGNSHPPQQFKDDVQALIADLRLRVNPSLPIIIMADVYRNLPPDQAAYLDRYPGVAYAIAQEDPLVCAVNSRRLTDAQGWNAANASTYLADGVHFTSAGAILKARLEVHAILDAFGAPTCDPDLNQDGNADQGDVDYLINVVAGGDNPGSVNPDFNHDGNVDQADIDSLINVVAGGLCP